MKILSNLLLISLVTGAFTSAFAADQSHYPYDNNAYSGEWSGLYFSTSSDGKDLGLNLMLDPSFSEEAKVIIKYAMKAFVDG